MAINIKLNGKSIDKSEGITEISFDISKGKDYYAETTFLVSDGVPHIINSHVYPELKNEFNDN